MAEAIFLLIMERSSMHARHYTLSLGALLGQLHRTPSDQLPKEERDRRIALYRARAEANEPIFRGDERGLPPRFANPN